MSSQFGFIDIILLAMFAGFIILRLRNILGRKTGHQGKPMQRYFPKGMEVLKDIENNEAIRSGNLDEEAKKKKRAQGVTDHFFLSGNRTFCSVFWLFGDVEF